MSEMSAEALNCPNCGAGVSSDRSMCEFCRCRLKTIACTKCLGLMFVGAQFCGHCGAIAAPVDIDVEQKAGECPRCRAGLDMMEVVDTKFRGCLKCDGLWLDKPTFENICADTERQSAVLSFFHDRSRPPHQMTKVTYVPCPDCGELMNRSNFARSSGVIVDLCRDHGVWFDADELPAIIEFVTKGGMEKARQRERDEIKSERERLRAERYTLGGPALETTSQDDSLGIRSFVRSLFG